MKHYYDDNGILQFDQNRNLLVELAKAMEGIDEYDPFSETDRAKLRSTIIEAAIVVQYDYNIMKSMGGIGGGLTLDEWQNEPEDDAVKTVLKKMLFDATSRGFMHNEFLLIAWAAACEVQLYRLI